MKFVFTEAHVGTKICVNDNWITAMSNEDGTRIVWSSDMWLDIKESFSEFCAAVKASRRFAPDMKAADPEVGA